MDRAVVCDRAVIANVCRADANMHHDEILDVAVCPDSDVVGLCSNRRVWPETNAFRKPHIPIDLYAWGAKKRLNGVIQSILTRIK